MFNRRIGVQVRKQWKRCIKSIRSSCDNFMDSFDIKILSMKGTGKRHTVLKQLE